MGVAAAWECGQRCEVMCEPVLEGGSCWGIKWALLGSNLGHRWHCHTSARWVSFGVTLPPFFLSLNLPDNCLNPLPFPSKAHFLPSFGSLDQRKWDSRSSPARLLSHAPSASPWGGRTDGQLGAEDEEEVRR